MMKPVSMNEYIAGFPAETQEALNQVRVTVKNAAPGAKEKISYGIPTVTVDGKYLIYFAGYKRHIGVYPVPTKNKEFEKYFSGYKTSGKGAIQFPLDKPMPLKLLTRIVKFRLKDQMDKGFEKKDPGKAKVSREKAGHVTKKKGN